MAKIKFDIPKKLNTKVVVFDILGREIVTLLHDRLEPGIHEVEFNANGLPEGTYFYKIITEGHSETRKKLITK